MIDVNQISFRYGGNAPLFENFSVKLDSPQVVAIIGTSGSGKTTLLKLIARLLKPYSGSISIPNSGDIATAWVPQDGGVYPWLSVKENVELPLRLLRGAPGGLSEKIEKLESIVQELRITNLLDRLPRSLSGGQIQRVALARALTVNAKVLLLDEPFSALDAPTTAELRKVVRRLTFDKGIVTIVATHDLYDAVEIADSILGLSATCPVDLSELVSAKGGRGASISSEVVAARIGELEQWFMTSK